MCAKGWLKSARVWRIRARRWTRTQDPDSRLSMSTVLRHRAGWSWNSFFCLTLSFVNASASASFLITPLISCNDDSCSSFTSDLTTNRHPVVLAYRALSILCVSILLLCSFCVLCSLPQHQTFYWRCFLNYNFDIHTTHSNIQHLYSIVLLICQFTPLMTTGSVLKIGGVPIVCQKFVDTMKCFWH